MQIVKRGTRYKGLKGFLGRNEEDDQPGRYLQHNPEKTQQRYSPIVVALWFDGTTIVYYY